MRWVVHVVDMKEMRNAKNILVGKTEGKRPLQGPRCRWDSNIKMYLRERDLKGGDWIHVFQVWYWWQTLLNMVMNL
jgi:hypothetical protein